MKPYGDRGGWEHEAFAPPTRITGASVHNRKSARRKLHRQARTDSKRDIRQQLWDYYGENTGEVN